MKTKSAMIISDKESIIIRSIQKKLQEMRVLSLTVEGRIDRIDSRKDEMDIFIVFLPDEISEGLMEVMVYLADYILEVGKPIVFIGSADKKIIITTRFRKIGDQLLWFDRPLDVEILGERIEEAWERQEKQSVLRKILIVDDDPNYARMVRDWLKDYYKVDMVASGAQSLTYLTRNTVDLILLDYEMPVVDGPQVLQMLREDSFTATIPVIFLTGVDNRESVKKVVSLKPQGYILKSTTRTDLLVTLNDFFMNK